MLAPEMKWQKIEPPYSEYMSQMVPIIRGDNDNDIKRSVEVQGIAIKAVINALFNLLVIGNIFFFGLAFKN